jgi:Ca-activated chloride channel homolog
MRTRTLLLAILLFAIHQSVRAQGWIEPGRQPWVGGGIVRVHSDVSVHVTGRIARVEVEESFQNRGGGMAEGDYIYPLPGEAVFNNFSLFQGDQELRGETMDADKARSIYEEIVRRKRDPALIELVGHGLVRARVFPINAGETRKITLRYTQVLPSIGDGYEFRYAAPARSAQVVTLPQPRRPMPEDDGAQRRDPVQAPMTFVLTVDNGVAFRAPTSPTHDVRVARDGDRWVVTPTSAVTGAFTLILPLARPVVGASVVTHKPSSEAGYFMLTLSPGQAAEQSIARDLTVVLDVSGSMAGAKMDQSKQALRQLLSALSPNDRFRLIAFNGTVTTFRSEWAHVTPSDIASARTWINELQADGGTNIADALQEAFRLQAPDSRLGIVLFLTDGLPSTGERDPERIAAEAERLRARSRLFAFGVGYDVNTYLLDRLTAAGHGTTQYVTPGQDINQALGILAAKIRHPVLTDLEIANSPVNLTEVYPSRLPDLFSGDELVVFGRYTAQRSQHTALTLAGSRAGRRESYTTTADFPDHQLANDFIPRLWAARKVGALAQELKLRGPNAEIEQELRETALRYGVLSEYTSYLVQEPNAQPMDVAAIGGVRRDRPVPPAPAVQSRQGAGVSGQMAVASSNEARKQREVKSAAELDRAEDKIAVADAAGSFAEKERHIATRVFLAKNGVLTDARADASLRTQRIEPFSNAYFQVLKALPELTAYWRASNAIAVAGQHVSIVLESGGVRELSPDAVQRLVAEFRGR